MDVVAQNSEKVLPGSEQMGFCTFFESIRTPVDG